MKKVIIYSTPTCVHCNIAKTYFDNLNIPYETYDVSEDMSKREEMVKLAHGRLVVPIITIDDEVFIGFNEINIQQAL